MNLTERQREHFNQIADDYLSARTDANHLKLKDLIWSEFFRDRQTLRKPGLRVLDAMCGNAEACDLLRHKLHVEIDYSGFDYSDAVIDRVRHDRPGLNVWQGDVTTFRDEERYDLVVVLGGLHHVHHRAADAASRLTRSIVPGGFFLSLEPTHGNVVFGLLRDQIYRRTALFDEETEHGFSTEEWRFIFENAGLGLIDVMYPGLLSYVLYYNPDAFPALNLGSPRIVGCLFALERPIMRSRLARFFSFATLSLWQKPPA